MNFLNWNARGINSSKKRQILHDIIVDHKIDLIAIQETKKEKFNNRVLKSISTHFDIWEWVPSIGRSSGILFGCDSSKFSYISHTAHQFSLDIHLECKTDGHKWQVTIVYGPVDRSKKPDLWIELDQIRGSSRIPWILCGDFNVIRHRNDKSGSRFDMHISKLFNNFVNRHQLVEHKLINRKYTWNNGRHFALLDRFFTSMQWEQIYPVSFVTDLSCYGSDHCPLILQISSKLDTVPPIFRFDPLWVEQPEFVELVHKWWNQYPLLSSNIAKSWNAKLKFLRQKIRGWARNFYSQKKKEKRELLARLQALELILECRTLLDDEFEDWINIKHTLDNIYLDEERHWQTRSK